MIVKIQNRRGGYTDYDPSKLLPGEFAVVQVGDPNTPTGKGVYLAITAGDVVRLATTEEIAAYTQQFDDIYQSTLQDAGVILDEAKLLISNYTGNLIVVNSISDMTDTSNLYLYNGSGEYKNYVYVYDPEQSAFVPLINYGMFADLSGQISQNTSNIATNTANIATNTASIATNTTNIATNASNIAENAVNIAGLAVGVTNKVVKTTLSTTQIYANETVSAYNSLSIPGLSDYMVVMVFAVCGNTRQRLVFVNGDAGQQYMYTTEGNNKIRAGCYVDWEGGRVRIRYLSAEGAYTYQNVYFTDVVGFIKQGAIDGSDSSDFTPYQALYDAIIAYIDEHYTPSSSDSVPNEVKQAIYTLLSKAAYTETGLTDELAVVESWTATTFNITNSLTNCASSNSATVVNSRTQYTATLTANTGYVLNTVTVTMGGDDITSTTYSGGTITIPSVTGNIVITATAVRAVASISAVYTQSGSVYDTATLSDLTADLVVTATYSDSSTAVIPSTDYTLSGTLAVGTSTVTVTYGGKTATFTVTVEIAPIPSVYELSAATVFDGTNYIDTEYILTNQDKDFTICFEFTPNSPMNGAYIFDASHNSSNALNFRLAQNGSGYYRTTVITAGSNTITASAITNNAKVVMTHTAGESTVDTKWAINGGSTASSATTTLANFGTNSNYLSQTQTIILGAKFNTNDYKFTGTINQFIVYESVLTDAQINQFLGVSE